MRGIGGGGGGGGGASRCMPRTVMVTGLFGGWTQRKFWPMKMPSWRISKPATMPLVEMRVRFRGRPPRQWQSPSIKAS